MARRGMVLSSSKRTIALAASPLIAENAGSPWLFRLVIEPAHRCSRRRLLFEAACSRGRELALCKGALAAEHRQDADLQLKGRHISWRSCAMIAICHTSLARSCYRRDGAGRSVFFLWPVGQPQTLLPLFGCHARAGCRRRRRSRALRCVFVVLGSGPF